MSEHPKECAWHVDQYPWECTCGLVYRQHRDRIEQLTAEVERLRDAVPVVWSEPSPPNDESSYDHCIASFKFGTLKAEWKSWKDHPGYTVFFEGCNNFIGTYNTLADAKKAGETWVSTAMEKDV